MARARAASSQTDNHTDDQTQRKHFEQNKSLLRMINITTQSVSQLRRLKLSNQYKCAQVRADVKRESQPTEVFRVGSGQDATGLLYGLRLSRTWAKERDRLAFRGKGCVGGAKW